jgi:hypothetical protein
MGGAEIVVPRATMKAVFSHASEKPSIMAALTIKIVYSSCLKS